MKAVQDFLASDGKSDDTKYLQRSRQCNSGASLFFLFPLTFGGVESLQGSYPASGCSDPRAEDPWVQPWSTRRGALIKKKKNSRKTQTQSRTNGSSQRDMVTLCQMQTSSKLESVSLEQCPNLLHSAGKPRGFQGGLRRQQRPKSKTSSWARAAARGNLLPPQQGCSPALRHIPHLCSTPPHRRDHIRCIRLNPCSKKSMPARAVILD